MKRGDGGWPDPCLVLAISGGGTRAAAFGFGVLEALSECVDESGKRTLGDCVGAISGVSGGSITAAYFALHGPARLPELRTRFLERNMIWPLLRYAAHENLLVPLLNARSELLYRWFSEHLYDHRTLAHVFSREEAPLLFINATDVSAGRRFTFSEQSLEWIGQDPADVELGFAVAASAAFPFLASPLTLTNRSTSAPAPPWAKVWLDRAADRYVDDLRRAQDWVRYHDPGVSPYVHLVDGGLADNTGVRALADSFSGAVSNPARNLSHIMPPPGSERPDMPRRVVVIAVNARTGGLAEWARDPRPPNVVKVGWKAAVTSMELRTDDSMSLVEEILRARAEIEPNPYVDVGDDPATIWNLGAGREGYGLYVGFDQDRDVERRQKLMAIGTNYWAGADNVDLLVQAGKRLLLGNVDFRMLCARAGFACPPPPP